MSSIEGLRYQAFAEYSSVFVAYSTANANLSHRTLTLISCAAPACPGPHVSQISWTSLCTFLCGLSSVMWAAPTLRRHTYLHFLSDVISNKRFADGVCL
ncbi:hypothetical protein AV530_019401 [Patagioenas fasciata monilis]|uniref:Uncharacterized protein n=1 Tax=Patagioenas fasciata monilis TaxID=372326 RepID=A0A1V4JDG1_PATFA|nr:hypothetical protein AV530_019401 [Patagioenas fasciata monilis]